MVNLVGILSSGGINNLVSANVKSNMHRLSIAGQIANNSDFSWKAGINISGRTSQVQNLNITTPTYTSLEKSKEKLQ